MITKKPKSIIIPIAIASMLCVAVGAVLLLQKPVTERKRQIAIEGIVSEIRIGQETLIVDPDQCPVEGEGYEDPENILLEEEIAPATFAPEEEVLSVPDTVTLKAAGTISISSIDLVLPLWDEAGIVSLRYGAGLYKSSSQPGENGNVIILGHRMKKYGSLFNRLGEVACDDEIMIQTIDGETFTYEVTQIYDSVLPKNLLDYFGSGSDGQAKITLVTCTPTGVGTHRLLVVGQLLLPSA